MVTKFVIFLVICGLILFFVAEMFVEKSFKVFKRQIAVEAVSCIAVLLVGCALLQFDIFGIESYVPQVEEISEAAVDCVGNFVFTDEEELEAVTDVHQYIVDQIPMLKRAYGASYENYRYMTIRYTLKSGKWVSRSYYIQCDDKEFLDGLNQKLAAIEYSTEAAKRSYFGTDYEALDWQVLGATIECLKTDTYEEYTVYGSEEEMQELYTAVLADIDAGAIWGKHTGSGEMTVESAESADEAEDTSFISAVLSLSLGTDTLSNEVAEQLEHSYHTTDITGSSSQGTNVDVSLSIDENFTHTIETLVKLGTIESAEDLRVE
jgi:catabolite regulation protein CreA